MRGQRSEVRLTVQEHARAGVLRGVLEGKQTQVGAARVLGLTDRWIRELVRRFESQGPAALVHGNSGRPSNRKLKQEVRDRIVELYREKYQGFNLSHFRDMLARGEKMHPPSRESLRAVLKEAGLWERQRKAPKHRQRRARRDYEGEMLQMDGSDHRWFGPEGPTVSLVGAIDDATSEVVAVRFFEGETTESYFWILKEILRKRGVPGAVYSDRDSIFLVHDKHQKAAAQDRGGTAKTQFGRALEELSIEWIPAYSPQAKGRIERLWRTFQDRLLKEMRLMGIKTIPDANEYLTKVFLPDYNRQFKRQAPKAGSAYRPAPVYRKLEGILAWKESRKLPRDHVFRFEGKAWQVLPSERVRALTGKRIEVRRTLQGAIQAWVGPARLSIREAPSTPPPGAAPLARGAAPAPLPAAAARPYRVRGKVRW